MQPRVTTRVIARESGFAQATVSMALRNDSRIPAVTRQHIRRVAARLGYRPDAMVAKLMASVQRRRVGDGLMPLAYLLCWPSAESHYAYEAYRKYREGAATRAAEFGYRFEDFLIAPGGLTLPQWRKIMAARAIPGVLIAPVAITAETPRHRPFGPLLRDLAAATIGYSVIDPFIARVAHDHFDAIRAAVQKLWARGHRRVGFVTSREVYLRQDRRMLGGFREISAEAPPAGRTAPLLLEHLADGRPFHRWFRAARPAAILATEWPVVHRFLQAQPRPVPVFSLDLQDGDRGRSGWDQAPAHQGAAAFDMILAQIHRNETHGQGPSKTSLVKGRWIEARSRPRGANRALEKSPQKP